jgi:2-phosphosulfolactate phosphatase
VRVIELSGIEAASSAAGHVVLIDVLRAFTCAAVAFRNGAAEIQFVATLDEARALGRARPDVLLMGHGAGGTRPDGFDLGNSPWEVARAAAAGRPNLRGRTIVQRTGSGTQGVVQAISADRVYVAALVNASATARHLRALRPGTVSLVALGAPRGPDGPEDVACRDLLAARLRREEPDVPALLGRVAWSPAAAELRDPGRGVGCPEDVRLATDVDADEFAMVVTREPGQPPTARAVNVCVTPSAATPLPQDAALAVAAWRLGRVGARDDVERVVDAVLAAGFVHDDLCVLAGRRGPPAADDFDRLGRALRELGVAMDDESARVVESIRVLRGIRDGSIPPLDGASALWRACFRVGTAPGLHWRPWYWIDHAADCAEANGHAWADDQIRREAADLLRALEDASETRPTSASRAGSGTPSRRCGARASRSPAGGA